MLERESVSSLSHETYFRFQHDLFLLASSSKKIQKGKGGMESEKLKKGSQLEDSCVYIFFIFVFDKRLILNQDYGSLQAEQT